MAELAIDAFVKTNAELQSWAFREAERTIGWTADQDPYALLLGGPANGACRTCCPDFRLKLIEIDMSHSQKLYLYCQPPDGHLKLSREDQ